MNHTIINPELTEQEKQKVKMFREHNPKLRLWLFEKYNFRSISSVYNSYIAGFQRRGYIVREISLDFNTD